MQLVPGRVDAEVDGQGHATAATSSGEVAVGPLAVGLEGPAPGPGGATEARWWVANRADHPVAVRSVARVLAVVDVRGPLRILRHGYQSWSPTGVATFGVDSDPSHRARFGFMQAVHHADQRQVRAGELRSEWMTVLVDDDGPVLVGFDGGHDHDGTLRLRAGEAGPELWVEAFLGDAVLAPGERRDLHAVVVDAGGAPVGDQLARWAAVVGQRGGARTSTPFTVGWCSWYHYFHDVTESALDANLARADAWPFDLFQLDDGYQAAIGDWRDTNDRFPSTLDVLADRMAAAGRRAGLWLAPFLAAPDAGVTAAHPGWLARHRVDGDDRGPLRTWWNPSWGGGEDGFMYGLDTTHPEVLAHLEELARDLVDAGFSYLKLDFTFSPSVDGGYHDPGRTPAQRVRAGYDAIRRGAGEDTTLLGCGVPLAHVVGVVDANRIGQDVAPRWALGPEDEVVAGYLDVQPATRAAWGNTAARSFLHRRVWANDPDCVMLRSDDTDLSPTAARTWAHAVALSGGLVVVSDDLSLLGAEARAVLDETVALGRAVDAEAVAGRAPTCPDLLDHAVPTELDAAGCRLVVDPADGSSTLLRPT